VFLRHTGCFEEVLLITPLQMMFDSGFYYYSGASAGSPSWMVCVIDCIFMKF
jgi:hypothetical protein